MTAILITIYLVSAAVLTYIFVSDEYKLSRNSYTYGDLVAQVTLSLVPVVNTCFAVFFAFDALRTVLRKKLRQRVFK